MEIQLNLDKICRLCLEEKSEQLQDVFGSESNLCENILHATTVKVQQGDGLPAHVCQQCVSLINVIVNFQRKCVVADLALHHYIRKCNCHKERKECEAVKFYTRDPLQLTRVIKTEGGPCQIKSETSVFQFQESREEVITGIIEEVSSSPRVSVKPEESESGTRTSKTVKAKQTNGKCISINCGQNTTTKVHKRRRRKGHRWKIKKQSSVSRKRALGVRPQNTGPLQVTEICTAEASIQNQKVPQTINSLMANKKLLMGESGLNRIITSPSSSFMATEEGLPNTMSSSTLTINKGTTMRGYVLKTRKSGNSNSVVASKNVLLKKMQKETGSSVTDTITGSKNLTEENPQNKRASQQGNIVTANKKTAEEKLQNKRASQKRNIITANKKTVEQNSQNKTPSQNVHTIAANNKTTEENLQSKTGSQNSNIVTVNKKTASKECQQNSMASDTSKTFLANEKSLVEEPASIRTVPQSNSSVLASQRLVMPIQMVQQSCNSVQGSQKLEVEEHRKLQAENSSNRKPATTSDEKLRQSSKSIPVNQKLVAEDQIQRVSPMRKALKSKPVTEESTLNGNVVIAANEKLVADECLQNQRIPLMRKSLKKKPVMKTSTLTGNMTIPANEKLEAEVMKNSVLKKQVIVESTPSQKVAPNLLVDYKLVAEAHVRILKVSPSRNSLINKPISEESTLNQSIPQNDKSVTANQKVMVKQHVQTQRVSLNRSVLRRKSIMGECLQKDSSPNINSFPTNKTPETAHNAALLPSSETFQPDKLAAEEDYNDTFSTSEKHLQGNNITPTKRKTPETESSAPFSTKKQKPQENDRLMKLVIQVEGNKLCCSQCDSWFNDVEKLKRHLEELHKKRVIRWHTVTGPGPEKDAPPSLICASCSKQFTSQRLFTLHQNQKSCF